MDAGHHLRTALTTAADRELLSSLRREHTRTGSELLQNTQQLAGALATRHLARSRIGLWYQNSVAAFEAFLAVELLGATRLPVDPGAAPSEARGVFEAGNVDAVLADGPHAELLTSDVLVHDDEQPLVSAPWTESVPVDPDTPLILYPRGVAGHELFGVTTSYRNWSAIMQINQGLYRDGGYGPLVGTGDCFLTIQQLMHATGMVGSFPFLLMGLPQVVLPQFDAALTLEAFDRHQATSTFAVPGMLTRLADHLEETNAAAPTTLRRALYGGAPIDVPNIQRLQDTLGDCLCQLYGRFEAGWPLAVLNQNDHHDVVENRGSAPGSCGRAVPGVSLQLRETPGRTDGTGELCAHTTMISPDFAEPDGSCTLGDIATIENGYIHLKGRLDGMINSGSYHVYPFEVEHTIVAIPGVTNALVRGEPDPIRGQAVIAYLTTDSGLTMDAPALREHLKAQLASYKVPKAIRFVDTLPSEG